MTGFRGTLLRINLSTREIVEEKLDTELAARFGGGSGLAAYYYWQDIKTKDEIPQPLAPENKLYFFTGAMTGLPSYCTSRSNFCARSPQTGFWGESNIGGKIGPKLKFAGYDGLIIEGKADKPVFIQIYDSDVQIRDAEKYWGLDTYQTFEKIIDDLPERKFDIVSIGPAGENLVKYACIMTHGGRTAGRTGMGAIMGSKNLKAIAIKGSNLEFDLPKEYRTISKEAFQVVKDDYSVDVFSEFGTSGYVDVALELYGDMPIRNWSKGEIKDGTNLSGITMAETILVGKSTCYRCPIKCGREVEIKEGKYKVGKIDGPEFEAVTALGSNLEITDLEAVVYSNYLANKYGIDVISSGSTIGVLFDLVDKGFTPKEDLPENLSCKFGDIESVHSLLKLITYREGIGDILAEGSKKLAEKYNQLELAPQVAGLEAPFHDPRAFSGLALMYVTSPRGACHMNGDAYFAQQGQIFPDVGVKDFPNDRFQDTGVAKPLIRLQSYRQLYNAIGLCQFYNPPGSSIAKLLGMALGKETSTDDLILIGDRIFALKRLINSKLGWTTKLEKLPKVMLQKLDGPTKGAVPDVKIQLKEWYQLRNYDEKSGLPKSEEIKRLGLEDII